MVSGDGDAVYQNITDSRSASRTRRGIRADHIYRMDIRQMMDFHLEKRMYGNGRSAPCFS